MKSGVFDIKKTLIYDKEENLKYDITYFVEINT